jgi:hypothetical protein
MLREPPKHLARIISANFVCRVYTGMYMIVKDLMYATVHLALDLIAIGSLIHQAI